MTFKGEAFVVFIYMLLVAKICLCLRGGFNAVGCSNKNIRVIVG